MDSLHLPINHLPHHGRPAVPYCSGIWRSVESVPGWMAEDEVRALTLMATLALLTCEGNVLEIGSYHGRGTIALAKTMLDVAPDRTLRALDPGTGDWVGEHCDHWDALLANLMTAGVADRVQCIRCHPMMEDVNWTGPLAFVLIDGAHGLRETRRDFDQIVPHVAPGGIAAFRDDMALCVGSAMHCREMERRYGWQRLMKTGALSFFRRPTS